MVNLSFCWLSIISFITIGLRTSQATSLIYCDKTSRYNSLSITESNTNSCNIHLMVLLVHQFPKLAWGNQVSEVVNTVVNMFFSFIENKTSHGKNASSVQNQPIFSLWPAFTQNLLHVCESIWKWCSLFCVGPSHCHAPTIIHSMNVNTRLHTHLTSTANFSLVGQKSIASNRWEILGGAADRAAGRSKTGYFYPLCTVLDSHYIKKQFPTRYSEEFCCWCCKCWPRWHRLTVFPLLAGLRWCGAWAEAVVHFGLKHTDHPSIGWLVNDYPPWHKWMF